MNFREEAETAFRIVQDNTDFDLNRLIRAKQMILNKVERPYKTTLDFCSCLDFYHRKEVCKHILALTMSNIMKSRQTV